MKIKMLCFLLFCAQLIAAQNFNGRLIYKVTTKCLIADNCTEKTDTLGYVYDKSGNYLFSSTDDKVQTYSIYKNKENLIYNFNLLNPMFVDAIKADVDLEKQNGFAPVIHMTKDTVTIAERSYNVVEVKWKAGIYRYYFVEGFLKMDAEVFKKHEYDQWYEYLKIAGALPVRIDKIINGLSSSTYELQSYEPDAEYDADIFDIPKMKKLKGLSNVFPNRIYFEVRE